MKEDLCEEEAIELLVDAGIITDAEAVILRVAHHEA